MRFIARAAVTMPAGFGVSRVSRFGAIAAPLKYYPSFKSVFGSLHHFPASLA
jgi:hypothetical protein